MPTYSYRCKACNHAFDIVQAFSDDSLTACPECAGALRKVFGNVAVSFKGSGFYRNDSRDSASQGGSRGDGSSSGQGASGQGSSDQGSSSGQSPASSPAEGGGSSSSKTEKSAASAGASSGSSSSSSSS